MISKLKSEFCKNIVTRERTWIGQWWISMISKLKSEFCKNIVTRESIIPLLFLKLSPPLNFVCCCTYLSIYFLLDVAV